jgi:uncharacterized protein related to proFAR isomerase
MKKILILFSAFVMFGLTSCENTAQKEADLEERKEERNEDIQEEREKNAAASMDIKADSLESAAKTQHEKADLAKEKADEHNH